MDTGRNIKQRPKADRQRLGAMVALLAVLMNFALPMTHGAAATDRARDGYVEICTSAGIQLVAVSDTGSTSHEDEGCAACVTCPLCQIQAARDILVPPESGLPTRKFSVSKIEFATALPEIGLWSRYAQPQSRAPPLV